MDPPPAPADSDGGNPDPDPGPQQTDFEEVTGSADGWRFLREADGAPRDVWGATEDEAGNLWVAGGDEGLFLLKQGSSTFQRFGLEHGLQPYGLWNGEVPAGDKKLKVIAVTGGPPGVVFVGYEGVKDTTRGIDCESEMYRNTPGVFEDPNVIKSGDADRVELQADGTLRVVHYDLHSPDDTVPGYGHREKLCTVNRIVWDKARNSLWFAANHGMAWGQADFQGGTGCASVEMLDANGDRCAFGVMEHVHPAIEMVGFSSGGETRLAGDVFGIAIRPDGDVWMGTHIRTSRFRIMTNATPINGVAAKGGAPWDFEAARKLTEDDSRFQNRIDVWPDLVPEPTPVTGSQRVDDLVSGLVLMNDGTVYVSSFAWGLAQLNDAGQVVRRYFENTSGANPDRHVSSLGRDPRDESLWLGHWWEGGVSRIQGGKIIRFDRVVGNLLYNPVRDIQFAGTGESRRVLVAFSAVRNPDGTIRHPGGVGLYTGP
ncbi:MAG: hypothetical protein L0Y66_26315 [Myxococcaceae bacterium]|nr:hypothetical protein [Myxococcaceae bacterium]MCI0669545.1 hypothetical protein [Myxococcaceae bacterium]